MLPDRKERAVRRSMAAGGRHVRPTVRFAANELFARRTTSQYQVRRTGQEITVRHPMADAVVVKEVLGERCYDPPAEVRAVLPRGPFRIVDLGAHIGTTAMLMLELFPDAHVLGYEANPANAAIASRNLARNGLDDRCELRVAAAGVAPGKAVIEGHSVLSHLARPGEKEVVDLVPFLRHVHPQESASVDVVDVLPHLQDADLVKIDIEGGEWPILQDDRFKTIGAVAVVLEYHKQGAPSEDAQADARSLLERAGFTVGESFDAHSFAGLFWAWRAPSH